MPRIQTTALARLPRVTGVNLLQKDLLLIHVIPNSGTVSLAEFELPPWIRNASPGHQRKLTLERVSQGGDELRVLRQMFPSID